MTLEITRHLGDIDSLAPAWDELLVREGQGAPFRSYAWVSAWLRHAAPDVEPQVLVAREHGRIVALLPLYAEPTTLGGRRLRIAGDGTAGSDYVGIVAAEGDEARSAPAFAQHLAEQAFSELYVDGLAEDDPFVIALAAALHGTVERRYDCPYVRLAGDFDAYLHALPEGTGAQWSRRRRWLERRPGYAIECLRTPAELARGLDILFELHEARWHEATEALGEERLLRFHRDALGGLTALGFAAIDLLHVEGQPRAALYGFQHGDRFAFYQAGRDPAWQRRAVGTVLLGDAIRRAFAGGLREFDFLHGDEAYKARWANGRRGTVAVRARGHGPRAFVEGQARVAWSACRRAMKSTLSDRTLHGLRRLQSSLGLAHTH